MTINLWRNTSPTNSVTKELIEIASVEGTLRDASSILDPSIVIELPDETAVASFNYFQIPEFNRFYYVTNVVSVIGATANPAAHLWELHGHVDVLYTYKDSIREQNAVVARQESEFNMYLDDGTFMSYSDPIVQTLTFSNATPFESQEFVLVVAGS